MDGIIFTENDTILSDENAVDTNNSITSTVDSTLIFGAQRDSLYLVIPITVIYAMIFVTGLIGNSLTITVITKNKSMHTATNYYLVSLAISDLLLLISGMPQELYSIWSKWPYVFGEAFCMMRGLAAETSSNASVLTITLFTIERYVAICHPFQSHAMSKLSRATKHVIILWVMSFLLALPQALQFGIRDYNGVIMCLQTRVIVPHSFEISTVTFFFSPMIIITVFYLLIAIRLNQTNNGKIEPEFNRSISDTRSIRRTTRRHSQSTKRVVKMLVAVVVAFFVCWAPFHAQRLVAIYGTNENHTARNWFYLVIYSILTYISGIFYYLSTCINPILYHIMCHKFREAFKGTILWCCFKKDPTTLQRLPYSALAFARVPTFSRSDSSGNNNVSIDNVPKVNRAVTIDIDSSRNRSNGSTTKEKPLCGGKQCHHSLLITNKENLHDSKMTSFTIEKEINSSKLYDNSNCYDVILKINPILKGPSEVSLGENNMTDDAGNEKVNENGEPFEDELTSYIHEVKERLEKQEKKRQNINREH